MDILDLVLIAIFCLILKNNYLVIHLLIEVGFFLQDGLFLVTEQPGIIDGYTRAVLTPNKMEFIRLYEKIVSTTVANDLIPDN